MIPAEDCRKHLGKKSDLLSAGAVINGPLLSRHKHFLTEIWLEWPPFVLSHNYSFRWCKGQNKQEKRRERERERGGERIAPLFHRFLVFRGSWDAIHFASTWLKAVRARTHVEKIAFFWLSGTFDYNVRYQRYCVKQCEPFLEQNFTLCTAQIILRKLRHALIETLNRFCAKPGKYIGLYKKYTKMAKPYTRFHSQGHVNMVYRCSKFNACCLLSYRNNSTLNFCLCRPTMTLQQGQGHWN